MFLLKIGYFLIFNLLVSYGVANFPKKQGFSRIECQTWSPSGSSFSKVNYDALSFYFGNKPRIQSIDILSKDVEKRCLINSHSNGKIIIEIEVPIKKI
jgi:hypothetical protein